MQDSLTSRILELKKKRNAVILAHNYQLPEVQDVADFVGDSLGLSIEASKTSADVIVFCGVHFMAETAKILSPLKKVLMPDSRAGCPMADMINERDVKKLREQHPDASIVCYVNTSASVKAECDVCCTSGNAVEVVRSLGDRQVVFVPDQHLGSWVEEKLNKKMVLWPGFCNVHTKILPEHIKKAKADHPGAVVMCHPECTRAVRAVSDHVASTSGMVKYPGISGANEFVVATETGIIHQLENKYPGKRFYPALKGSICPNMKLTSLEKVLWCLEEMKEEVSLPPDITEKARSSIEKMVSIKA